MDENQIGELLIGAAIEVHRELGPGLLESTYEACLELELTGRGLAVERQVIVPVRYKGADVEGGYRIDLRVGGLVIVEIKSIETVQPVHKAQLVSYLRLGGYRLGYLINFNERMLRNGITRLVNGL